MTATLDELEARIAALEAKGTPDSLQSNVITIAPDGTIGADFTGDVLARTIKDIGTDGNRFYLDANGNLHLGGTTIAGLIVNPGQVDAANLAQIVANLGTITAGEINGVEIVLPANDTTQNPAPNPDLTVVKWVRQSDGSVVAQIGSQIEQLGSGQLQSGQDLIASAHGVSDASYVALSADDSTDNRQAGLDVRYDNVNGSSKVTATAGGGNYLRQLIDQDGQSDYVTWGNGKTATGIQAGQTSVNIGVGSPVFVYVNLPRAWTTGHYVFVASINPSTTWTGFYTGGADTVDLTRGIVSIYNTSTNQGVTINWISFGL